MTTEAMNSAIAEACGKTKHFGLMKRGLWYRPNARGYTSKIEEAGRYSLEEAKKHECVRGDEDDVTIMGFAPPDYLNDITARKAAWRGLTDEQKWSFRAWVAEIARRESIWAEESEFEFWPEIFLRAIGKYIES